MSNFKEEIMGEDIYGILVIFIATVSENTEEQIRNYIKSQKEK